MKTVTSWDQISQYHSKCVCQTCTCHKHRCPKCEVHLPFQDISSYQNDYHKHPISTFQKSPPQRLFVFYLEYGGSQPYGNISSNYQQSYPGFKPQMREKHIPRVKNQDRNVPFDGQSEYKNKYPGKYVAREPINNKDKIYSPLNQPFDGDTTYKTSYPKKQVNPHDKKKPQQYDFPSGYKFNGETTYGNSFTDKIPNPNKSYKPHESLAPTGQHDLNTIYRKDYDKKKIPEPCPILKMPQRPSKVSHPSQHLVYNKNSHSWEQK